MPDQIREEIDNLFKFLDKIYSLFGFEYKLELSTRPDSFLGEIETWNAAEKVGRTYFPLFSICSNFLLNRASKMR